MVFVGCSKPSSKADDGIDNRDDIKTHMAVEDVPHLHPLDTHVFAFL
jgi:hypothetical protein